jgi:hypothetical protein
MVNRSRIIFGGSSSNAGDSSVVRLRYILRTSHRELAEKQECQGNEECVHMFPI